MALVLGIETSCDECSASVLEYVKPQQAKTGTLRVLSLLTHSQIKLHQPFGGIVPEVASRNHLETINPIIQSAFKEAHILPQQLDAIAVTNRPGLAGALLVGVSAAKAMAYALRRPLVPVHHLEGHAMSIFLNSPEALDFELPLLLAIVSGGHTQLHFVKEMPEHWPLDFLKSSCVGRSRDDAAGEAFDKTAKLLGFPYPGGLWIDRYSKGGDPHAFAFPRALPQKATFDFSFSGLKTAVALEVQRLEKEKAIDAHLADLCAAIQEAIVEALWNKMRLAIRHYQCRSLAIVGGVAANSRLRQRIASEFKGQLLFPALEYCTDNGAMIAAAGVYRYLQGAFVSRHALLSLNAFASAEH